MMIPINDQLRINSDSRQWMIERKRTRKGKESWEARFYFGNLKSCLKDLGELILEGNSLEIEFTFKRGIPHSILFNN